MFFFSLQSTPSRPYLSPLFFSPQQQRHPTLFFFIFFAATGERIYPITMPADKSYALKQVQTFGKKKTAIAVATVTKAAQCNIKVNGVPLQQILPDTLRAKIMEAVNVVGSKYYSRLRVDVTVRGGGQVSQAYAARQAIAKGLVAYFQKYHNEVEKAALKDKFLAYDKFLLIADPRRCEPKKWGRHSARTRFTKSYR